MQQPTDKKLGGTLLVDQPENQPQTQKPVKPAASEVVHRIIVDPHPVSIQQLVTKFELVTGVAVFVLGLCWNFLLFMCVLNSPKTRNGGGKGNERKIGENVTSFDEVAHEEETIKLGVLGMEPPQHNVSHSSVILLMICSYLVLMYGIALFWTNYRLGKGLSMRKYFYFFLKWTAIKLLLFMSIIMMIQLFADELQVALRGLYFLTTMYCLHSMVVTIYFFNKISSAVRRLYHISSAKKQATMGTAPETFHTVSATCYKVKPLKLIVTYRGLDCRNPRPATPSTQIAESANAGHRIKTFGAQAAPGNEVNVKESKILID